MLMKLSSWVTSNATPRVGSYRCHSTLHGVITKNFVVVIFGVWIFRLLQLLLELMRQWVRVLITTLPLLLLLKLTGRQHLGRVLFC